MHSFMLVSLTLSSALHISIQFFSKKIKILRKWFFLCFVLCLIFIIHMPLFITSFPFDNFSIHWSSYNKFSFYRVRGCMSAFFPSVFQWCDALSTQQAVCTPLVAHSSPSTLSLSSLLVYIDFSLRLRPSPSWAFLSYEQHGDTESWRSQTRVVLWDKKKKLKGTNDEVFSVDFFYAFCDVKSRGGDFVGEVRYARRRWI